MLVFLSTSRVLVRLTPTGNLAETPRCLPELIFRDVELGPDKPAQQKSPRNFFIARVDVIGSGAFYSAAQRCHCFFFAPESGVKKLENNKNMSATHLQLMTRRTLNPNHHLWNNNGTWWCYVTLRNAEGQKIRHRFSLETNDLEAARRKRDRILNAMAKKSGNIEA